MPEFMCFLRYYAYTTRTNGALIKGSFYATEILLVYFSG